MLEVIGMSVEDCIAIEKAGADRIELVSSLAEGGLTPSAGMIEQCYEAVSIPIRVKIRPHSRNFYYSPYDIEVMKYDIEMVKSIGCEGVTFGVLDENGLIHRKALECLLKVSEGLEVTFDQAFDKLLDLESGLEQLLSYSAIKTILTLGGAGPIEQRVLLLHRLIKKADNQLEILVGGDVNEQHIQVLIKESKAVAFQMGRMAREKMATNGPISIERIQQFNKQVLW